MHGILEHVSFGFTEHASSLPSPDLIRGLTRQSISFVKSFLPTRWTPGSSPGVTKVPVARPSSSHALRRSIGGALLAALTLISTQAALALDKVRLGKAVPNSFAFSTAEIGIDAKIWEQEGLEIAVSAFRGDAQMQQGLIAGAVDVALGSGPGLGFRAKGVPAIGVAAMYGPPANLALTVLARSQIRTIADL